MVNATLFEGFLFVVGKHIFVAGNVKFFMGNANLFEGVLLFDGRCECLFWATLIS